MGTDNEIWEVYSSDEDPTSNLKNDEEISDRMLELFQQIARDGHIELKGHYPRRGNTGTAGEPSLCEEETSCIEAVNIEEEQTKNTRNLDRSLPQEFDYDECTEGMSLPLRTPKSGKKTQKKRIGSFDNVVSNIHRFRQINATMNVSDSEKEHKDGDLTSEPKRVKTDEDKPSEDKLKNLK